MNYRLVYLGLGLALVAVVALAVALGSGGGDPIVLPEAVEAVSPRPGDSVQRQAPIEVDMRAGYDLEMFIDGVRIPDAELVVVPATGVFLWRPGPNQLFEAWSRGNHDVRILWNTTVGLTDTGSYDWSFFSF